MSDGMSAKEALELAHEALNLLKGMTKSHLYAEASRVLRNGSEKVEVLELALEFASYRVDELLSPILSHPGLAEAIKDSYINKAKEQLKIVPVRSEPTFKKVEE